MGRNIVVSEATGQHIEDFPVEIVERKGIGHPDSLCDGIAEEIMRALGRIPELQVASRTGSFQFRNRHGDIRDIGAQLNVTSVLEGTVRLCPGAAFFETKGSAASPGAVRHRCVAAPGSIAIASLRVF